MLRISVSVLPLRRQAVILSMLVAVLVFASAAAAAIIDFNVAAGTYNDVRQLDQLHDRRYHGRAHRCR